MRRFQTLANIQTLLKLRGSSGRLVDESATGCAGVENNWKEGRTNLRFILRFFEM